MEHITLDPEICHGKSCVRGLRYPVEFLLESMHSGMTHSEILSDYDDMEAEDLTALLKFAIAEPLDGVPLSETEERQQR